VDVIDICTPNYLHAPIAISAAQAGKIVLCEKPLAMSVEEAERMADAAQNIPTLVWFIIAVYPRLLSPKNWWMRED